MQITNESVGLHLATKSHSKREPWIPAAVKVTCALSFLYDRVCICIQKQFCKSFYLWWPHDQAVRQWLRWQSGHHWWGFQLCLPPLPDIKKVEGKTEKVRTEVLEHWWKEEKHNTSILIFGIHVTFSCFDSKLNLLSPGGGWPRWDCPFSAVRTGEVRAVVWPSALGSSFAVNHLLGQPDHCLWVLGLVYHWWVKTHQFLEPGTGSKG